MGLDFGVFVFEPETIFAFYVASWVAGVVAGTVGAVLGAARGRR